MCMREITHSYLSTLDCCFAVVTANGSSTCNTWPSCKLLEARASPGLAVAKERRSDFLNSELLVLATNKSEKSMAQHGLCITNGFEDFESNGLGNWILLFRGSPI
jgi:hypothetical protein